MPNLANVESCTGCTACESVCPCGAIRMEPDGFGFLYPKVDASKCCNCGKCEKACVVCMGYDTSDNLDAPVCYGVRHKRFEEILKSRSGAAFVAISDYVLLHGGVVYGAGYDKHFRVVHKRASCKKERDEFRGSKYVQSDLRGVFRQVIQDLTAGLTVMFTGTPCQTAALNAIVTDDQRKNLLLVDLVCHGVPSPDIWRDYLAYIESKKGKCVVGVDFRDKMRFGWADHRETFTLEGGGNVVYR